MNVTEHLLWKLAEECAEVAKEASKAALFGMEEVMPGQALTNRERVLKELNDLWAAAEMLGLVAVDREAIARKKAKVLQFMDYAESIGTLQRDAKQKLQGGNQMNNPSKPSAPESPAKEQPGEQNAAPQRSETPRDAPCADPAVAAPDVASMMRRLRALLTRLLDESALALLAKLGQCPRPQVMGEHACKDRTQCWEPCGDLGHHHEEYAQPAPPPERP